MVAYRLLDIVSTSCIVLAHISQVLSTQAKALIGRPRYDWPLCICSSDGDGGAMPPNFSLLYQFFQILRLGKIAKNCSFSL